eukprot:10139903-Lingulodinium_polyedra.AAC.1
MSATVAKHGEAAVARTLLAWAWAQHQAHIGASFPFEGFQALGRVLCSTWIDCCVRRQECDC